MNKNICDGGPPRRLDQLTHHILTVGDKYPGKSRVQLALAEFSEYTARRFTYKHDISKKIYGCNLDSLLRVHCDSSECLFTF